MMQYHESIMRGGGRDDGRGKKIEHIQKRLGEKEPYMHSLQWLK